MLLKTIRDAVAILEGVSESRLRRAVQANEVPSMKLGNRTLVDVDVARAVLAAQEGEKIEAVSKQTGLAVTAIRRAIREGWMPCTKPGKAYLFNMAEVTAAIERRIQEQPRQKKK